MAPAYLAGADTGPQRKRLTGDEPGFCTGGQLGEDDDPQVSDPSTHTPLPLSLTFPRMRLL